MPTRTAVRDGGVGAVSAIQGLHSAIWSAAAATPLWLCVHAGCAVLMGPRVQTAKAVSPSEADSATALQMGRRAGNGRLPFLGQFEIVFIVTNVHVLVLVIRNRHSIIEIRER